MPDLQVLRFDQGVPARYGDLNIPLNSDGTFGGDPVFISGTDKAIQDLTKGLLTLLGTNRLAPNYGTNLKSYLYSRSTSLVNDKILNEIRYLLGYLGNFNSSQDPTEQIDRVVSIKTTSELQSISVEMVVQTLGGTTTTVTIA